MQVAQAIFAYVWLVPLAPAVWLLQKIARVAAGILCAAAWDRFLQVKGVAEDERRKLITDAAQRGLKSP